MNFDETTMGVMKALYGEDFEGFDGAHSVRVNGESAGLSGGDGVEIKKRADGKPGIDVYVSAGAKDAVVHIPVVIDESGVVDEVYNDFYIGEGAEVVIMAGCGVHSDLEHLTQHAGVHRFHVGEGAVVQYSERHYGGGKARAGRVLNPKTVIELGRDSLMEIDTVQMLGVDSTARETECRVGDGAKLVVREKIMTDGGQVATTKFDVKLDGVGSGASLASRSVAKGKSRQEFVSRMSGDNACVGHSECDAIIMDEARVSAVPDVSANHPDAQLVHEAAIGKIADEQIVKLMSLGVSREVAEGRIVEGFLR